MNTVQESYTIMALALALGPVAMFLTMDAANNAKQWLARNV